MAYIKRKDFHMIEPDRDIILHCDDFMGDYTVEGRMIKYEHSPFKARFCIKDKWAGIYVTDYKEWPQRKSWEYK